MTQEKSLGELINEDLEAINKAVADLKLHLEGHICGSCDKQSHIL